MWNLLLGSDVVAGTGTVPGGLAEHQKEHPGKSGGQERRQNRARPGFIIVPQAKSVSPGLHEGVGGRCRQGEKADGAGTRVSAQ